MEDVSQAVAVLAFGIAIFSALVLTLLVSDDD